jgi:hypothetical protein
LINFSVSCDETTQSLCLFERTNGVFYSKNLGFTQNKDTIYFCQNEKNNNLETIKTFHFLITKIKVNSKRISKPNVVNIDGHKFIEYEVHFNQCDYIYYFNENYTLVYMRRTDWGLEEYCNLDINSKNLESIKLFVTDKLEIPPPNITEK